MTTARRPDRLWSRNFQLYFVLRTVSLVGDGMMPIAVTIGVLAAGYGAAGVGYALAAWSAPMAVLVLFGGVLADRFTPRRMMIISDVARVGTQSLLAVVLTGQGSPLWQILCLQAAAGAATATFQPGVASLLPRIARDVQRANGLLRIAEAMAALVSPAVAGLLATLVGAGFVLAVDAATFGVSALCLLALRLAPAEEVLGAGSLWRDLFRGWREFRARTWVWSVILIWSLVGLLVFGPAAPLAGSLIVDEHGSVAYGIVWSAFGAGTVCGGLLAMRVRPRRPLAAGAAAAATFALAPGTVAVPLPVAVIAAGFLVAGVGMAFWSVLWLTTMQTHVPPTALNRVYAYDVAGSTMILPIGRALAAPAADLLGIRHVLLLSTICGLAGSAAMLAVPAIRTLRRVPVDAGVDPL